MVQPDTRKLDEKVAIELPVSQEDLIAKLAEYEDAETEQDRALRTTYEAIQAGEKIVDVMDVITRDSKPGFSTEQKTLPTLAFAPATAENVTLQAVYRRRFKRNTIWKAQFATEKWKHPLRSDVIAWRQFVKADAISVRLEWMASVPYVPLGIRKDYDIKDPNRVVLFEVSNWLKTREDIKMERPPRQIDPLLMRHLTGTLYVVEAVWDFSDHEAKLIAGIKNGRVTR